MSKLNPVKVNTHIRFSNNNGREYGYKPEYIMVDLLHDGYIESGLVEAKNIADIPNARKRAIRAWRKIEKGEN